MATASGRCEGLPPDIQWEILPVRVRRFPSERGSETAWALVRAWEKAFLSDAVVSAAQAGLGGDFKLFKTVRDGRNQLVLRVKGVKSGSMIIFR